MYIYEAPLQITSKAESVLMMLMNTSRVHVSFITVLHAPRETVNMQMYKLHLDKKNKTRMLENTTSMHHYFVILYYL